MSTSQYNDQIILHAKYVLPVS